MNGEPPRTARYMTPPRGKNNLVNSIRDTLNDIDAAELRRRRDRSLGAATRRALESGVPQRVWVEGQEVEIQAVPVRGSEGGA